MKHQENNLQGLNKYTTEENKKPSRVKHLIEYMGVELAFSVIGMLILLASTGIIVGAYAVVTICCNEILIVMALILSVAALLMVAIVDCAFFCALDALNPISTFICTFIAMIISFFAFLIEFYLLFVKV